MRGSHGHRPGGPGYQFANETTAQDDLHLRGGRHGQRRAGHQRLAVLLRLGGLELTQPRPGAKPDYTIFATVDKASRDIVAGMAAEGQDGSNPDGTGKPNNPSEIISAKKV